jgi:hypothetical protein
MRAKRACCISAGAQQGGAERHKEAAAGVLGHSPQQGPGAELLAGARGRSPPKFLPNIGIKNMVFSILNARISIMKAIPTILLPNKGI